MSKNYEVVLWEREGEDYRIKHGCVKGELFNDCLKTTVDIEQKTFFQWIERLTEQLDAAQKHQKSSGYKYLNPYSVLISETGAVYLLDLEAQSNLEVVRSMQRRSMRHFFPEARSEGKRWESLKQNLYAFGQLLRFMTAEARVSPAFTKRQKRRLHSIIEKCIEEKKHFGAATFTARQYEAFSRVRKEIRKIPVKVGKERKKAQSNEKEKTDRAKIKREWANVHRKRKRISYVILGIGTAIMLCVVGTVELRAVLQREKTTEVVSKVQPEQRNIQEEQRNIQEEQNTEGQHNLYALLLNNRKEDNLEVIAKGEAYYRELLYCLALAYEREDEEEKALHMYEDLCKVEEVSERLETIYAKRIRIEEKMNCRRALQTAKEATEKEENSEMLAELYLEMYARYGEETGKEYREQAEKLLQLFPYLMEKKDANEAAGKVKEAEKMQENAERKEKENIKIKGREG